VISGWLHIAVVKIVTTYTRPGDRVLLLGPPDRASGARWPGSTAARWPGRYAGLHEAAWTIVRLGRSVQTHTAAEPDPTDPAGAPTVPARIGSDEHGGEESGSGPGPDHPRTAPASTESACPDAADQSGDDSDPGRFALIITAVYPRDTDWLHTTAWTNRLQPNGTLAVITHGDRVRGRLVDPTPAIVGAGRRGGLVYIDHIALLEVPLRRGHLAATQPAAQGSDPSGTAGPAQSRSSPAAWTIPVRVHSDLHVFGPVSSAVPGAASDAAPTVTPAGTVTHIRKSSDV